MLAKCANTGCSTVLQHGEGKFFRFQCGNTADGSPRNSHGVEHFWLCRNCAEIYTLEYDKNRGVLIRRRFQSDPRNFFVALRA